MKKIIAILLLTSVFQFVQAQESKTPKVPIGGRPDIPANLIVEFGFNRLNNRPEDLGTRFFASRSFNIYYQYPLSIFGDNSGFTFNPGFGIATDKLAFKDESNLFHDPDKGSESSQYMELAEVYGESIEISKNTFALSYFEIPLDFTYHLNKSNYSRGFRFSVGGKIGFLYNAHSKVEIKNEEGANQKIKDSQNFGINKLRYGLTLKMGSPGFYGWTYIGLNPLFQENRGPFNNEATSVSFGVAVNLF